jgi:DsbC/DsbD-like thiol-disulfide interchange protein
MARLGAKADLTGTVITAPHLRVTTFATDAVVAPGTHFSLVVDVTPLDRVHVYAPGVTGYKPIALTVTPQAGLLLREATFPKSEIYFFKPLNERVAVYQRPFRIVQDLVFEATQANEALMKTKSSATIEAMLDYQACDDKVCFNPQSIPLSWTMSLRPLDRERPLKQ